MRRDAIFYQLFQRFPPLFFELLGESPVSVQGYRFESVEVKEPTFRIDGVFLPPEDAVSQVIFFAEVQFQKDQSLYYRFFAELHQYIYRHQDDYDDWYGVLIYPTRGLEPDKATLHRSLLNSPQVLQVYLDELSQRQEVSIGLSLLQLIITPEAETVERARQLITRAREEETGYLAAAEIIEVITTIAVYKFANFSREEVEAMLGLSVEQTRVYQEAKAEGREEGREEGRLEGREEGRLEMLGATIPLLLQAGMTIEEIAGQLQLDVALIQQVIAPSAPESVE